MDVGRQKLRKNCDFELSIATLTHEMDVGRQKLRKDCDFTWSIVTLSHETDVGRQCLWELEGLRTEWHMELSATGAN